VRAVGYGPPSGWSGRYHPRWNRTRRYRLGGIGRTTVHHWSQWAVVRYRLLIGLFEFKLDRLNMNSPFEYKFDRFLLFEVKKIKKYLKHLNFVPHPLINIV
jgi:hypothetical protein